METHEHSLARDRELANRRTDPPGLWNHMAEARDPHSSNARLSVTARHPVAWILWVEPMGRASMLIDDIY